jgi:transcription antitermination factor NusG
MSSIGHQIITDASPVTLLRGQEWYAIQTRPRHEKRVATELQLRGITTFLPLITEIHRWSDRRKAVEVPLFSCYAFVAVEPGPQDRLAVLRTPGVLSFVGTNHCPSPIPESELANVRTVLSGTASFSEYPFLKIGQRVRVCGGALNGVEGILVARNGERGLVVSIDAIERSLMVRIEGYEVEPVNAADRAHQA